MPAAVVAHEHKAETDTRWLTRRTLWHWRGIARFVRKHPERLRARWLERLSAARLTRLEAEGDLGAQLALVVLATAGTFRARSRRSGTA